MATGYVVAGRGDLDVLFKARVSAAGPNVGYKIGGVDLSQRFEPIGVTPAIPATGFFVGGFNDVAQYFMNIGAVIDVNLSMTAGQNVPSQFFGYHNGDGAFAAFGSVTSNVLGASTIGTINWSQSGANCTITLWQSGVYPPNTDQSWQSCTFTGVFADSAGLTVNRVVNRVAGSVSDTVGGGHNRRTWTFATNAFQFINGNTYAVQFKKLP